MTRIAIFSVKYSPNLGDGLLSECLEHELQRHVPGLALTSLDLAGRAAYGRSLPNRKLALRALGLMPKPLRRFATRTALERLARRRLHPAWRAALADCDAAIIGGGNLFADADLNFPIKINVALQELRDRGIPVAVYGVGVTRNWSPAGHRLFSQGLADAEVVDVTVRDTRSQVIWNDLLATSGAPSAGLSHDPGLLTARYFPAATEKSDRIGFCITDPVALRYHAAAGAVRGDLRTWYDEAIAALAANGRSVILFTNGSPEDEAFLALHANRWASIAGVSVAPSFDRPAQLAECISRCAMVIAHRMHACIAAHSYGIPAIGLAWDVKLNSFFDLVGRSAWVIDPAAVPPSDIPALAQRATSQGIDAPSLRMLIEACSNDVRRLADTLLAAAGKR
ncbi:polysaccharide pyruvyl transferase family protein [Sphingomonas sp. TDK1]|uniref:polysaccharide pyruvyl transferase family protein n=1 Tax=Sphingomonas sp. TDK1 TaxID=453247 RepID=UPI0007D990E0|nr:polysaccharide pyruvyl transferase family protein [Sphingomonas sp. TDK1]OAN66495.1 hypothetical protein A7X12_10165 [Sphingomonas sp. TDK1]